jgi:hypothetical protein
MIREKIRVEALDIALLKRANLVFSFSDIFDHFFKLKIKGKSNLTFTKFHHIGLYHETKNFMGVILFFERNKEVAVCTKIQKKILVQK